MPGPEGPGCGWSRRGLLGRILLLVIFALGAMTRQTGFLQLFLVFLADLRALFLVQFAVLVGVVSFDQFLAELALFLRRSGAFLCAVVSVRRADERRRQGAEEGNTQRSEERRVGKGGST